MHSKSTVCIEHSGIEILSFIIFLSSSSMYESNSPLSSGQAVVEMIYKTEHNVNKIILALTEFDY